MAFTKAHLYEENDRLTSYFAMNIGHPARICILRKLHTSGSCIVEELMHAHPLSQPSISQHLKILRKAHLVDFVEIFPHTYYSINKKNYKKFKSQLKGFLKSM